MSTELFRLDGRTAMVTGARTGIGRAIAVGLAAAGADLVLVGHRDDLGEVAEEAGSHGAAVEQVAVDLLQPRTAAEALHPVFAARDIDVLVNNAGIVHRGPVAELGLDDWQRVLDIDLNSVFALSGLAGRQMLARGSGKIINIASLLSFQGGVLVPAYAAAKHAVAGLTKSMANEWAPHGVQVNAIAPGYIATGFTAALREDAERDEEITRRIPAGRWGRPDDLVGAAVFLASAASDYVNGHVLVVDGGWLAR
ncbi:2-deoxy-D-gluconate 3-dehydrogenase [Saccharopolyspora erythraea NRRL 2338]|uniref:2-deoxy-D-gluconate 3-dehydrogenase n=2 Tax=Saccharopolyspora erythraea TaxID=1836 RepID=A4F6Q4_SACEN|nr:SDR family oxidoreductase [Saccharopolyspora erythraea]EQD87269.1 3-oxoacyl-ACP reductase [Saccharopolyspora erythraea D]PFG93531.1 2-deoxy-D-gluconate 3-dehydrogenase [Saccharopolyspora erythraea NRRL 2338]QRK90387.1 SDR family oxidoreductase [Saccharopolyspora erythraea]CAL99728.1 2-deoxy-D-gluconate 3-dehydrogenase [Saccharopolyspora erythraea NRRL 2338]